MLSPTNEHTPVWGPLAVDDAAIESLTAAVLADRPRQITVGCLGCESGASQRFVDLLDRAGYHEVVQRRGWSPYADVSVDAEVFNKRLSAKRRGGLRRNARRLGEHGELTFVVQRDDQLLDVLLDEAYRIEASGWKGAEGAAIASSPATRRFYSAVAHWAARHGSLMLVYMRLDDRMLAFSLGLDDQRNTYGLKIGYDEDYARWGPGVLLMHRIIDLAVSDTTRVLHMLGDNDPYKQSLSDGAHERQSASWFAPTITGRAGRIMHTTRLAMDRRLRSLDERMPERVSQQMRLTRSRVLSLVHRARTTSPGPHRTSDGQRERRSQN